jgi:general secretion pathway protein K
MMCNQKQGGIALVQILMISAMLAVMVLSFSRNANSANTIANQALARTNALIELQSAESKVLIALLSGAEKVSPSYGVVNRYNEPFRFDSVEVHLQDMAGLLTLHRDSTAMFRRFLESKGLSESEAVRTGSAIEDWQDRDSEVRPGGAEQRSYRLPVLVRNAPFQTESELSFVLRERRELFSVIEPFITLYPNSYFNPLTAPKEILQLYVLDGAKLDNLLKQRAMHKLSSIEFFRLSGLQSDDTIQATFGQATRVELRYDAFGVGLQSRKELIIKPYDKIPVAIWSIK